MSEDENIPVTDDQTEQTTTSEPEPETPEEKTNVDLAKEALDNLSESELGEIQSDLDSRKRKVTLITIDENGIVEYVNNDQGDPVKFNNAKGKLLQNRLRFAPSLRIITKSLATIPSGGTSTEDALLKIIPYLFTMLGSWGYRISDRNRTQNPDKTVTTNSYDLQQGPLDNIGI